jgi:hypothetical protein
LLIPPSADFTPVSLHEIYDVQRQQLDESLRLQADNTRSCGSQVFREIPVELGSPAALNLIFLDQDEVRIPLDSVQETDLFFVQVVENRNQSLLPDLADLMGNVPLAKEAKQVLLNIQEQ